MAEATERPADDKGTITPSPAAPSIPVAPPLAADEAPKPYSSVSLLAIGGFVLAVAYSAVVVVSAAVALFNHTPLLLSSWTLLVPFAAVVVSLAARARIAGSEGALTGSRLTTWAIGLSLGVGLVYGAGYYAGAYWALTKQAKDFTDGWLELLRKDDLNKAFLLTLPPPRPSADDPNLRGRIETEFDRGGGNQGQFTQFRWSELVRQFEQGGADAQVQFLGVKEFSYDKGAYNIQLSYRLVTRAVTSDLVCTAVGVDSADESGTRQWYVRETIHAGAPVMTDEGERITALSTPARMFAQQWVKEIGDWQWDKAYLDTLPVAERQRLDKERDKAFKDGLDAFRKGGFVRTDPATFWAPPNEGDAKIAEVRGLFGRGGENPDSVQVGPTMPVYRREGDRVFLGFDVTIQIPPVGDLVQGRLTVAADSPEPGQAIGIWRVDALDLISVKSLGAPNNSGPPRGPTAQQPGR
jgi:hypothetical protein